MVSDIAIPTLYGMKNMSVSIISIHLGKLYRPHYDLTIDTMLRKGNHPQMALFQVGMTCPTFINFLADSYQGAVAVHAVGGERAISAGWQCQPLDHSSVKKKPW